MAAQLDELDLQEVRAAVRQEVDRLGVPLEVLREYAAQGDPMEVRHPAKPPHVQSSHGRKGPKGLVKKAAGAIKEAVDGDGSFVDEDAPASVKKAQAELQTEYNIWSAKYGDDPDRWPDAASQAFYELKANVESAKKKAGMRLRSHLMLCTRAFDFELDTAASRDGRTLEGYAAVFNTPARIRDLQGDFDEVILPGAFTRSLAKRTPKLQWDHGKDPRIGTTPIGKFQRLAEDSKGLHVRARLFTHPDVERIREAIAEGAIDGMSFRFAVPKGGDTWSARSGDVDLREVGEADTFELGPVAFQAYDTTSVSVRSLLAGLDPAEIRELVHELDAHLRGAVDLTNLTGRPSARSAGGGEPDGPTPSPLPTTPRESRELRLRGIIR